MSTVGPADSASNVSRERESLEWVKNHTKETTDGEWRFCTACTSEVPLLKKLKINHGRAPKGVWKNRSGWSTNAKRHLMERHGFAADGKGKCLDEDIDSSLLSFVIPRTSSREMLLNAVAMWVVKDQQPFTAADTAPFRHMLKVYREAPVNIKLPSRDTLRRHIQSLYVEQKAAVIDMLSQQNTRVHVSLDCWTSPFNQAFLAIAGHFIEETPKGFKRSRVLLGFEELKGGHGGRDMLLVVKTVADEFGISGRLGCMTGDNASSNEKLAELLLEWMDTDDMAFFGFEHVRCLAHVINLAAKQALTVSNAAIIKVRAYAKFINASPKRKAEYERCCRIHDYNGGKLDLDVATRWNSTFFMIKRALAQIDVLRSVFTLFPSRDTDDILEEITENDLSSLGVMLELLEMLEISSNRCVGEDVLLSTAFLQFSGLVDFVYDYSKTASEFDAREAAFLAHTKLSEYFAKQDVPAYYIAVILDPRFKMEAFELLEWASE